MMTASWKLKLSHIMGSRTESGNKKYGWTYSGRNYPDKPKCLWVKIRIGPNQDEQKSRRVKIKTSKNQDKTKSEQENIQSMTHNKNLVQHEVFPSIFDHQFWPRFLLTGGLTPPEPPHFRLPTVHTPTSNHHATQLQLIRSYLHLQNVHPHYSCFCRILILY